MQIVSLGEKRSATAQRVSQRCERPLRATRRAAAWHIPDVDVRTVSLHVKSPIETVRIRGDTKGSRVSYTTPLSADPERRSGNARIERQVTTACVEPWAIQGRE